ncbi:MAG: NIPSNAP family protein [Armatimonadota bacterium]
MNRRRMLICSSLAPLAPLVGAYAADGDDGREYYELRRYRTPAGAKQDALVEFLGDAAVPAWNRAGVRPVGIFREIDATEPIVFVLLPHQSLESFAGLEARLADDAAYQRAGAAILDVPKSDPAYERIETSLMVAFKGMPRLERPVTKDTRIFELRTYESHSIKFGRKKVHMFNEGGEIDIFRKTRLRAVFFGQDLVAPHLPSLTYMLGFDDMADHDASWDRFLKHPDWQELRKDPQYKDTVSNITRVFLRPEAGSQI